jgi:hypothetical protein
MPSITEGPESMSRAGQEIKEDRLAQLKKKTIDTLQELLRTCPSDSEFKPLKEKLEHFLPLVNSDHANSIEYMAELLKQLSAETAPFTTFEQDQALWDFASPHKERRNPYWYKIDFKSEVDKLLSACSDIR